MPMWRSKCDIGPAFLGREGKGWLYSTRIVIFQIFKRRYIAGSAKCSTKPLYSIGGQNRA